MESINKANKYNLQRIAFHGDFGSSFDIIIQCISERNSSIALWIALGVLSVRAPWIAFHVFIFIRQTAALLVQSHP